MTEHKWHKHKHTHIRGVSIAFRPATQASSSAQPCTRRCPQQTYVSSRSSRIHRCCVCVEHQVAGRIDVRSCSILPRRRCVYAYAGMLNDSLRHAYSPRLRAPTLRPSVRLSLSSGLPQFPYLFLAHSFSHCLIDSDTGAGGWNCWYLVHTHTHTHTKCLIWVCLQAS